MEDTKLQKGEIPAAICMFSAQKEGRLLHNLMVITRKNGKILAKSIIMQETEEELQKLDVSTFDREAEPKDEREMANIQEASMLSQAKEIASGQHEGVEIKGPFYSLKTPQNATIEKIINSMEEEAKLDQGVRKITNTIYKILGLKELINDNFTPTTLVQAEPQKTDKGLNALAKAKTELDLINKYGKKAITKLAKQIGYHGETINKQKIAHVKKVK
jgi:hypothetical protein